VSPSPTPARGRRAASALLGAFVLAALALAEAPVSAEPVKLLKPEDYQSRIVAGRKGRVLLVNFWATWCEPCREEMPDLVAAAKKFPAKDLAVVLVSLDSQKTGPTQVPKFLKEKKVPFVSWLAKSRDPQVFIDTVDRTWDGSLPYTLVYGRDGKIATRLSGLQTEASFTEAIRKAVGAR
jgi:thiol-disulfide isomerase/thioredoxin